MGGARFGRSPHMNAGAAVYAHRTVRCGVPRGTAAAPADFGGAIAPREEHDPRALKPKAGPAAAVVELEPNAPPCRVRGPSCVWNQPWR